MTAIRWISVLLAIGVLAPAFGLGQTRSQVAFPEGYRTWAHVKSEVILKGHKHFEAFGGFHHVYANQTALAALKQGGPFPKGAVLVFELLLAVAKDKAIVEGPRLVVGVMEKDSDRFPESAGWGFEDFKGGRRERAVTDARRQCLSCHAARKTFDYVYSVYRR